MNRSPRSGRDTAAAGALLVGTVIFCALVGLGLGAAVDAEAPLAILGGGVGLAAGFWLVYSRFRDI